MIMARLSCASGTQANEPQKEVFAVRFDPTGQNIASAGFDRAIRMLFLPPIRCDIGC